MFERIFKKSVFGLMAVSMLASGLPALAATTVIKNFKIDRDTAVADGGQYISMNYDVLNSLTGVQLNEAGGSTRIINPIADALEVSGNIKWNAIGFPLLGSLGGNKYEYSISSGGKKSAAYPVYIYRAIKFYPDMNLALSGGDNADANESLIIKVGSVPGQTLTPTFYYNTTAPFANANETYMVMRGKEIKAEPIAVEALPVGNYKVFFRGYNYATADKAKKYKVDGSSFVNLTVLAKPSITNVSIQAIGAITVKRGKCRLASADRGANDDIKISWQGSNLTKLALKVEGLEYQLPSPNRSGVVYFQPDCLTAASHSFELKGENTANYLAVAPAPVNVTIGN